MTSGKWADVRLPAPHGPTVSEHMDAILEAAHAARAANRGEIRGAIEACFQGKCLQQGDPPQPRKPPAEGPHGSSVLLARVFSLEADWDRCLAALQHGEAEHPRKQKA